MKNLFIYILLGLLLSCSKEPIHPNEGLKGESEEILKNIEWEGTMIFYYKGEKYESRFYHNKTDLNRITLEDKEANDLYFLLCWVSQSTIKVVESDGTVKFYDKSPGGFPTDENGFTTFYYGENKYTSRFWYDKNGNLVFEDEEANNVYLSICNLPNFGTIFTKDGKVIFYTEFIFPHIFE